MPVVAPSTTSVFSTVLDVYSKAFLSTNLLGVKVSLVSDGSVSTLSTGYFYVCYDG